MARHMQQFAYAVSVVTFNKGIEFAIVGANIRIDNFTLRATELSYPAVIAEISKFLQAWNTHGNIQLTYDDAAVYDYGMEMAKETFHTNGKRRLREPTEKERDALRSELWFEHLEGVPPKAPKAPSLHYDMLITWEQAKLISPKRFPSTVYPTVEFAQDYQDQALMPPAIVHIRCSLAVRLQNALIRKDMTYLMWCTENSIPLADLAIEWKATEGDTRFAFLGMAGTPAVFHKECNLSNEAIATYKTKLNKVTSMQLTAYYLAVGPSLFAKGPHQVLQQFVLQADFKQLNSYLAFARGDVVF